LARAVGAAYQYFHVEKQNTQDTYSDAIPPTEILKMAKYSLGVVQDDERGKVDLVPILLLLAENSVSQEWQKFSA
jgi:hypothetical protein